MSNLLQSDADRLIYGKQRSTTIFGLIFAAIGAVAATPGWLTAFGVLRLGFFGWLLLVVGMLFVMIGLGMAVFTDVLTLNAAERTWSWKRGWPGRVNTRRGMFSDLDAVGLHRETRRRSSGPERSSHEYTAWVVTLRLKESAGRGPQRAELAVSDRYNAALHEMESLSARLGIRMIDETGETIEERPAGTVQQVIRERVGEVADEPLMQIPDIPPQSRMRLNVDGSRIDLVIPVSASNNVGHALTVLIIAAGLTALACFFTLGLVVLWRDILSATPVEVGGIVIAGVVSCIGAVFIVGFLFIGFILLIEGVYSFRGLEHLEIHGDRVRWYRTLLGRKIWRKGQSFVLSHIRKVMLLTEERREKIEVVLRGDEFALGEHLSPGDRRWLADLLRALAAVPVE